GAKAPWLAAGSFGHAAGDVAARRVDFRQHRRSPARGGPPGERTASLYSPAGGAGGWPGRGAGTCPAERRTAIGRDGVMCLFMRTGLRLAVVLALASAARARAQGLPFQTIDVPGASSTIAWGINGRGQVVGLYLDSDGGGHGFLASGGTFAAIDVPGA